MLECPHCDVLIVLRELKHQGMFESYRICPNCSGFFEVDPQTKVRQAIFIVLALFSLALTLLLYFRGTDWLLAACFSYVLLGVLIYWGNRKVYLVPAQPNDQR